MACVPSAIAPRARTAMTADVFGDAPDLGDGRVDALSPEHVVTLVSYSGVPGLRTAPSTAVVHRVRPDG